MHFPTDLNLLWDAARKSVDLVARLCESCGLGGWRKAKHWKRKIKGQMRLVGKISQGGGKKSQDAQETLELTRRLFEAYGEEAFSSMSFDKGFSKTTDRQELEKVVPLVVMPKKGKLSGEDRQRESSRQFVRFKNRHSAIESNINTLEHHGLNRCPDKGLGGYKRYVGFGVLAYNLHRIGAKGCGTNAINGPGRGH